MPYRACLDCGVPTDNGARCPEHTRSTQKRRDIERGAPSTRGYDSAHVALRRRLVAEHVARHGLVCPGFGMPEHPVAAARLLTLDHVVPLARGGTGGRGNARVLCLSCNSRRRADDRGTQEDER